MKKHTSTTTPRRWTRYAVGGGLTAALALGTATGAFAAGPGGADGRAGTRGTGTNAKAACLTAVDRRLSTLDQLATTAAKDRDPANAAALQQELTAETAGLTDLRTQIDGAADTAALADLCKKVVLDYRVFALEAPTTHLAVAADGELAVATKLDSRVPDLQRLIDEAKAAGTDTSAAEAKLADLQAKTAAAHQAVTGSAATVIALTPAQFNGGEASPVLQATRAKVEQSRSDLKAAVQDAKDIVGQLRPSHG